MSIKVGLFSTFPFPFWGVTFLEDGKIPCSNCLCSVIILAAFASPLIT